MNLAQALAYFFREAASSLLLSWRGSALAILTCALSLYVGAFFFLVSGNLSTQTEAWRSSMKVSAYLEMQLEPGQADRVAASMTDPAWSSDAVFVSPEDAQERFTQAFPQVASALGADTPMNLPASIEVSVTSEKVDNATWENWIESIRSLEGVASVDDDRDWIREVQRFSLWVRTAGVAASLGLLIAAAFTIAAVVRLTAYQYLDEISVLRMVGATEFYVRGPFIAEGFLQGLLGSVIALVGLWVTQVFAAAQTGDSLWLAILFERFLSGYSQFALLAIGGLAGLVGSVLSIRRETLEEVPSA